MLPTTAERVVINTSPDVNADIRATTNYRVAECAELGRGAIDRRIRDLDAEWDIERTLETNASMAVLVGLTLGATVDRRFLLLPGLVAGFLLQHALQGWCPPIPVFRRLGIRTEREIDEERTALKALRGDFRDAESPETALAAARR
ncbi:MAG TPA: hypothetical protein VGR62_07595 [Candidatus Binatia bacterium]|jgi:hypothetical protein|nr:hypothetical protein [Candidatus Binatia bacterium]